VESASNTERPGRSRIGRLAAIALPAVAGVAVGVAASLGASRSVAPKAHVRTETTSQAAEAPASPAGRDDDASRRIERRLAALENLAREPDPAGSGEDPAVAASADRRPEDPADGPRRDEENFRRRVDAHFTEPVNRGFAEPAERAYRKELDEIAAAAGFDVRGVDCRTSSCVATVEWKSYGEAIRTYGRLMFHRFSMNCGVGASLPAPDDPSSPYAGRILFRCGQADSPG
jgi:hypothetical protein